MVVAGEEDGEAEEGAGEAVVSVVGEVDGPECVEISRTRRKKKCHLTWGWIAVIPDR